MARVRIAVIGSRPGVETVKTLASRCAQAALLPCPYEREEQAPGIVERVRADAYLFCGPVPFELSRQALRGAATWGVIPFTASALTKALWRVAWRFAGTGGSARIVRFSLDTIPQQTADEVLSELQWTGVAIQAMSDRPISPRAELVAFHRQAYSSGAADLCLTGRYSVQKELESLGIPAMCLEPTMADIWAALWNSIKAADRKAPESLQPAVLLVSPAGRAPGRPKAGEPLATRDAARAVVAALYRAAAVLAPDVGAAVAYGPGGRTVALFTVRTAIEQRPEWLGRAAFLAPLSEAVGAPVSAGLGFGGSTFEAYRNAWQALQMARIHGGCLFVQDDAGVSGPFFPDGTESTKGPAITCPVSGELSRRAGVPVECLALLERIGRSGRVLTASDLAALLAVSPRSSRRILARLARIGLVEPAGVSSLPRRGRPARTFRVRPWAPGGEGSG